MDIKEAMIIINVEPQDEIKKSGGMGTNMDTHTSREVHQRLIGNFTLDIKLKYDYNVNDYRI